MGPVVRVVKMTEPTVKVSNNAASPFNLSFDAKVPAGNPVVSTEGDLVEVIKKLFRQNGASWTVGMLSMVNILAVTIWSKLWCRKHIGMNVPMLSAIIAN